MDLSELFIYLPMYIHMPVFENVPKFYYRMSPNFFQMSRGAEEQ
jgi:hypothetical protein